MNDRGGSSFGAGAAAPVATAGGAELLRATGLDKSFFDAGREVRVLRGLELEVKASEEIAIVGQSGTGKSTLLHVLGSLETPTAGKVYFEGQDLFALGERARCWSWWVSPTSFIGGQPNFPAASSSASRWRAR
jgi:ABC-type glutathione transport system ATPase component